MFVPYVVEACGELLKSVVLGAARRSGERIAARRPPAPLTQGPPRPEGCPFCAAGKALAIVHSYLAQILESPDNAELYQGLSIPYAAEAAIALLRAPEGFDPRTKILQEQVRELVETLAEPIPGQDVESLVHEVWASRGLSFQLAERLNARADEQEQEIGGLGASVPETDAEVIDASARLVA